jgi:uncharacterized protein YkwD
LAAHRRRSLVLPALLAGGVIAAASATAVSAAAAHGQAGWHRTAPGSAAAPAGIRTLTGVVTLTGPAGGVPGTWVVFTLNGPGRMVRADTAAPFQIRIDTRTLPDGTYTFTVMVLSPGQPPSSATSTLRILNPRSRPPAASRSRTTAPSPTARPTATPTGTGTPAPPAPTAAQYPGVPAVVLDVLTRTNAERAGNGCGALRLSTVLTSVAQAHSTDMAVHDYFSHDSLSGATPFDRMTAAGYRYATAGENIAAGQDTPAAVMAAWMASPGHRANILNCAFTEIGVGYATDSGSRYGTYWTQDFAAPR